MNMFIYTAEKLLDSLKQWDRGGERAMIEKWLLE